MITLDLNEVFTLLEQGAEYKIIILIRMTYFNSNKEYEFATLPGTKAQIEDILEVYPLALCLE